MGAFPNLNTVEASLEHGGAYFGRYKGKPFKVWLSNSGLYCGKVNGLSVVGDTAFKVVDMIYRRIN
jgi:hypothetical protein